MIPQLAHFATNPAYGSGTYRRRLRFAAGTRTVHAQVDDTHHSYWLVLEHDNAQITGLEAGFNRAPTNMCPGSVTGLQSLVGARLDVPMRELMTKLPQTSNCTHLVDLAFWSIAHIEGSAVWEIEVPDQIDAPVWIGIGRDGTYIHRWQIADFRVVAPEEFAGKPLMSGFMRWAGEAFADFSLLAATMLQRGLFVARGRQHIVDHAPPTPLASAEGMAGMCWSYSHDRLTHGTGSLDYVRDFTDGVRMETPPPHIDNGLKDTGS
ncbi:MULTISPECIES: DUF2889 domain-containing protein [Novosphingobium]|uniref:DUF2889 domain-containing protein n=1 Tax=Novosphingobium TaxID=165696 RepID=UPI0022F2A0DE|nr:DUF2889 domain-containing protein [Novosphingobium resinovorum]GLK46030.1 hypothetical protein GCM10017612_39500 [Novosphingobium resinovorum]